MRKLSNKLDPCLEAIVSATFESSHNEYIQVYQTCRSLCKILKMKNFVFENLNSSATGLVCLRLN